MAKSVWNYKFIARAYELIKGGMSENQVAQVLGISFWTFCDWKKNKDRKISLSKVIKTVVRDARKACKGNGDTVMDWHDYVYQRLSDELKDTWRRINKCDSLQNGVERIECILADRGLRVRQSLFIHAWVMGNFSISKALKRVNVSKGTFDLWKKNDPGFAALIEELIWHKKNFVEDHLIKLIVGGDTSATIFANRTLNADRFPDTKSVSMNVQGTVQHNIVDLNKLNLPIKTKKAILKAIRQQSKTNNDKASE